MSDFSEELKNQYYGSIKELNQGDVVKGEIVAVTPREVVVDVGYKSEGIIPRYEFEGVDIAGLSKIDVYVENIEDEQGGLILSYRKAKETRGWQVLLDGHKEGDIVEGTLLRKVKGGYMVEVFGLQGFLPQSLSAFRNKANEDEAMAKKGYYQIMKMSRNKESFILSRRDALKIEREMSRKKIWEEIEAGKLLKGRIKSITNFGAFIDLGGVDGLLHIADMSWKKVQHPSEVVAVGDEIQVMVLGFEKDKGKISLGLKQTTPDPWQEIDKKYTVGSTLTGRVTNIQNYGIFVEFEKGIEGLVHISEISWTKKFINLNETYAIGDTLETKVISVNPEERKISLSVKQLEKDPWEEVDSLIILDSQIKGKVSSYAEGCAYAEMENGFEGIIYNDDISWTKRVSRAQDMLKRGHAYDFKILGIDRTNRKVILGMKQLVNDPWPQIVNKYPVGAVIDGEVVKITNFGVFVELEKELEGLVFSGEIEKEIMDSLKPKDKLKVKIIKIDPSSAKIGLSAKLSEAVNSVENNA